MGIKILDRREQRRLATREQLIDAAEKVFSERGYEQASILDITEAANLSKRTFYLHFADKDALISAIAHRHIQAVNELIHHEKEGITDPRESLRTALRIIFEYGDANPLLMETLFGRDASLRLSVKTREAIVATMEHDFLEDCEFRSDAIVPPELIAQANAGIIFQLLCWWTQNPNRYSPMEMVQITESILYDGIGINFADEEESL
jgi:AcrR family transcriptional regulator